MSDIFNFILVMVSLVLAIGVTHRIRVPFMVVMCLFSVLVMCDGWVVGAEPLWTPYRPVQVWTIGLYGVGAVAGRAAVQRAVAGLALGTYTFAGFFLRFMPGAFGS